MLACPQTPAAWEIILVLFFCFCHVIVSRALNFLSTRGFNVPDGTVNPRYHVCQTKINFLVAELFFFSPY